MAKQIQIIRDGILLGEIESFGDWQTDIESVRGVIGEKLGANDHNVAIACMNHAYAFHMTAQMLEKARPFERTMAYSYVVNLAFAVELYLKTLCALTTKPEKFHFLDDLLKEVSPEALATIEGICPTVKTENCELNDLDGLRRALTAMRDVFRLWRYAFEPGKSSSVNVPWLKWSAAVLHLACRKRLDPLVMSKRLTKMVKGEGPPVFASRPRLTSR